MRFCTILREGGAVKYAMDQKKFPYQLDLVAGTFYTACRLASMVGAHAGANHPEYLRVCSAGIGPIQRSYTVKLLVDYAAGWQSIQ